EEVDNPAVAYLRIRDRRRSGLNGSTRLPFDEVQGPADAALDEEDLHLALDMALGHDIRVRAGVHEVHLGGIDLLLLKKLGADGGVNQPVVSDTGVHSEGNNAEGIRE